MTLKYKILPDQQLIFIQLQGEISLEFFMLGAREIWATPRYEKQFNVLADLRKAHWKTNLSELSGFVKFLKNSPESATGKIAVLVNNPILTAIAGLFAKRMLAHQSVQVFSTEKAACAYVHTTPEVIQNQEHPFHILIK